MGAEWKVGDTIELIPGRRFDRVAMLLEDDVRIGWDFRPVGGVIEDIGFDGRVHWSEDQTQEDVGRDVEISADERRFYRLVPQPEPVRPEWVRLTTNDALRGHLADDVVEVAEWCDVLDPPEPLIEVADDVYQLENGSWEPADAPVDEPPQQPGLAEVLAEFERTDVYELDLGDGSGRKVVTMGEFIKAERQAGFNRTVPGYGPATAGFSANGVQGWTSRPKPTPEPVAETWKEGDWFTIDPQVINASDPTEPVTVDRPYRVLSLDDRSLPGGPAFYYVDDKGEASRLLERYATRCDPPVVDEPAPKPSVDETSWMGCLSVEEVDYIRDYADDARITRLTDDWYALTKRVEFMHEVDEGRMVVIRGLEAEVERLSAAAPDPEMVTVTLPRSEGVELIATERARQVEQEGYSAAHDAEHPGQMAMAAACYIDPGPVPSFHGRRRVLSSGDAEIITRPVPAKWPWEDAAWKPSGDRARDLVKAGALIAAEIDRLRAAASDPGGQPS